MKKQIHFILSLLVTGFFVFGLSSCKSSGSDKPIVTVTIAPQAYFAEKIAGDKFDIQTMVPNGNSPESFDPSPNALVNLSHSKAYFRIGQIGFEQAWMDKLEQANPNMKVFDNSKGIALITGGEHSCAHHGHDHAHDHDHDHGEAVDPHIWTSPANGMAIARNMLDAFIELDPANKSYYEANYDKLMKDIEQTSDSVDLLLKDMKGKSFVIYHPSLTYLANEYGMEQHAIENEGKEPSAAHLKDLIDKVRESGAHVIFIQQEFDEKNARMISDELGIKVVQINPLSYDWNKEMIDIAKALRDGETDSGN